MGIIGMAIIAALLALTGFTPTALAAVPSASDQQCLACHGTPGFELPVADGQKLSLHIDGAHFADSVHSAIGCTGCHSDIKLDAHPAPVPIASLRSFSISMARLCGNCHTSEFQQWDHSVHAALVRDGNPAAPVCTNCHSPHAVMKGAAEAMDTVPCKACHGDIFAAYASSVHGQFRSQGITAAPLCFGCHGAHGIAPVTSGVDLSSTCLTCHQDAVAQHSVWLPNVALHFGVVSCPACHAPAAHRTVDLILFNSATQKQTPAPVGMPAFENLTSAPGTDAGLSPTALVTLLTALNQPGSVGETSILGRLEVSTGVEAHRLTLSGQAISNCATCHRRGAQAFQSVAVSVAGPGGVSVHYTADKDVLSSIVTLTSIGGFYAIGGTRVGLLDILFVLAVLAAVGWSGLHLIVRLAFWQYHKHVRRQSKGQQ